MRPTRARTIALKPKMLASPLLGDGAQKQARHKPPRAARGGKRISTAWPLCARVAFCKSNENKVPDECP
jgi:hypothetical protein